MMSTTSSSLTSKLLLIMFLFIFSITIALTQENRFKNIVLFGDSMSDTGNFPEPFNVLNPSMENFNVYVPISNPLPAGTAGTQNSIPSQEFLEASIPKQGQINGEDRELYSINWPLYFAYNKGMKKLLTWYAQVDGNNENVSGGLAINYAWASAIVGEFSERGPGNCYHSDGSGPIIGCEIQNIVNGREVYREATKKDLQHDRRNNYSYPELIIPSLQRQIRLYLDGVGKNHQNTPTAFIVYIGLNDIGNFLKNHKVSVIVYSLIPYIARLYERFKLTPMVTEIVNNFRPSIDLLKNNIDNNSHIYILTLPHISNLHVAYTFGKFPGVTKTLDFTIDRFNALLQEEFEKDNKISVLKLGGHIDGLANRQNYRYSVEHGEMCVDQPGYLLPQETTKDNCSIDKNNDFFNWNNSHLTSSVNLSISQYLEGGIKLRSEGKDNCPYVQNQIYPDIHDLLE